MMTSCWLTHPLRRTYVGGAAVVILLTVLVAWLTAEPLPTEAATYNAGTAAQLINAINAANADPGPDTITLTANIALTGTLPDIASDITINGQSAWHALNVTVSGDLTLNAITIRNAYYGGGSGGAITNFGTLNLNNSTIADSSAGSYGGAVHNESGGTVTITGSTLSRNTAHDRGGAINNEGTLTITGSTLSGSGALHEGGGNCGMLTITGSTLSGNSSALGNGGAITNNGTLTINSSTLVDNTATTQGGGIFMGGGRLEITNNTLLTVYSWRVRALNIVGAPGAWSTMRTFKVDTVPPAVPVLIAPPDAPEIFGRG